MKEQTTEGTSPRAKKIFKVTIIGSITNLLLLLFKLAAGIIGHSAAMIADAVHSFSDFITDLIVLIFVQISSKPRDKKHDYGYGKYETMATTIIACVLVFVGFEIMKNSAIAIWRYIKGEAIPTPHPIALLAAILSIICKEMLFQYTVRKGRRMKSNTLVANAWHHRTDALSSIGTAIGIGGAILLGGKWSVLDPIAALIVSVLILHIGIKIFIPNFGELTENSLPEETEKEIEDLILSFTKVSDPHKLRTRRIGSYIALDLHIRMDKDMTLGKVHEVTDQIEASLRKKFGKNTLINIHVEPVKS